MRTSILTASFAVTLATLGFVGIVPQAVAHCTYNVDATYCYGHCYVNAVGGRCNTSGYCSYNVDAYCNGSCAYNVDSYCYSGGSCTYNVASTCYGNCQYNVASYCSSTGRCTFNIVSSCYNLLFEIELP